MESKTNTKLNSMTSKQVTKLTIFFEKLLKENYKTDRQLKGAKSKNKYHINHFSAFEGIRVTSFLGLIIF